MHCTHTRDVCTVTEVRIPSHRIVALSTAHDAHSIGTLVCAVHSDRCRHATRGIHTLYTVALCSTMHLHTPTVGLASHSLLAPADGLVGHSAPVPSSVRQPAQPTPTHTITPEGHDLQSSIDEHIRSRIRELPTIVLRPPSTLAASRVRVMLLSSIPFSQFLHRALLYSLQRRFTRELSDIDRPPLSSLVTTQSIPTVASMV
jgi:hypothetical protein